LVDGPPFYTTENLQRPFSREQYIYIYSPWSGGSRRSLSCDIRVYTVSSAIAVCTFGKRRIVQTRSRFPTRRRFVCALTRSYTTRATPMFSVYDNSGRPSAGKHETKLVTRHARIGDDNRVFTARQNVAQNNVLLRWSGASEIP